jgi:hypothetical protein
MSGKAISQQPMPGSRSEPTVSAEIDCQAPMGMIIAWSMSIRRESIGCGAQPLHQLTRTGRSCCYGMLGQLTSVSVRYTKCGVLILLQDAQVVPGVFCPFGAIPRAELREWLRQSTLVLPPDLVELWEASGGGDIFESETVFRPTVPSVPNSCFAQDDIEGRNAAHAAKGKPSALYIFQQGTFLSAVRLSDQTFVTLTKDYAVENSFGSLDDWYLRTLRSEFGERYGLASLGT